jgi:translation elongation factor EF-Tu-like GTPase
MITLYAYHEKKLILEKRILFLINKYDLVNDKEILKEYETQLKDQITKFFKKRKI